MKGYHYRWREREETKRHDCSFNTMSTNLKEPANNCKEKFISPEDQITKISEVRKIIGPLSEKLSIYCSDASIARYLRARNWHVKKAAKMLKETIKWRLEYKPEEIRWEDISVEAETGKIYKSNVVDKLGRPVLVIRPCRQNSNSVNEQIKHFVYCMENAIMNLPATQEQMVWLIDFHNFSLANISVKLTKETAHVLQEHYPERLGLAIMYNPPKLFEQFWTVVKPFLEPKTRRKVKFVYSEDANAKKIMEELFDIDQLESAFGGNNAEVFDINKYAEKMKEDDKRMPIFWMKPNDTDVSSSRVIPTLKEEVHCSDEDIEEDSSVSHVDSSIDTLSIADQKKVVVEDAK
ncbi:hypothetical protein V2J09_008584 [Rumex salicifolius]